MIALASYAYTEEERAGLQWEAQEAPRGGGGARCLVIGRVGD
jgi:hypothetical protein